MMAMFSKPTRNLIILVSACIWGGGGSLWVVNLIFSESTPILAPFVVYIGDLIRTLILTKVFEGGLQDS